MILVFFNDRGYYITGEEVEVAQTCSPATTERGDPIFPALHHTYKVLYLALKELHNKQVKGDVVVYNDSRIIDEMHGTLRPMDEVCKKWQDSIRRNVLTRIRPVVFFKKKPADFVRSNIEAGSSLLGDVNRQAILEKYQKIKDLNKASALEKFRRSYVARPNP